jgi:hypothetical protein
MRNAGSGVKGVSRIQCQRSATFDDRFRNEELRQRAGVCLHERYGAKNWNDAREARGLLSGAETKIDLKDRERAFLQ